MSTIIRLILWLLCIHLSLSSYGQGDSCSLHISLLTCSPGGELYSTFGHTAIRVTDQQAGTDVVFNYGTFNDSDPDFYLKFIRGLMLYALSSSSFADFIEEYREEQRGVIEQVIQLDCREKQKLLKALQINLQKENRYYNYYFHSDNCTTRARDIISVNASSAVQFKNILPEEVPSYRHLIHEYLNKGGQLWSKFGIDVLLGSNLDKKVTNMGAMFLPDYLVKGFDSAEVRQQPLVTPTQTLVPATAIFDHSSWFTPVSFFSILFLVIAVVSLHSKTKQAKFWRIFDMIFFLLLGVLGMLLVTLWTIRVDDVCRNNYNVFWASPTHLLVPLLLLTKKRKWLSAYFKLVFVLGLLLAASWFFLPQQLNLAILPLLGIILSRSYQRSKRL